MDEARDASVEGARGRPGGRRPGARRRRRTTAASRSASSRPSPIRGRWCASTTRSAAASSGKVKNITDFGVFVELEEGIDGLVHVSDLHWTKKVKHPSELFKKGDEVEAVVLGIDVDNERISLGVKQLTEDPWAAVPKRYPVGRARARQGHQRHRLRRLRGDRGGRRGADPRLAALAPSGSTGRRRSTRSGDEIEAEVTQVDAREKRDRALASRRCAAARSARRSTPTCSASARAASSPSTTSCARTCDSTATRRRGA